MPPHVKESGAYAEIVLFPSVSMVPLEKDRCNPIKAGRKEIYFRDKKSCNIRYNKNWLILSDVDGDDFFGGP